MMQISNTLKDFILSQIDEAIVLVDFRGEIIWCNDIFKKLCPHDDLIGTEFHSLYHCSSDDHHFTPLDSSECVVTRLGGKNVYLIKKAVPYHHENEKITLHIFKKGTVSHNDNLHSSLEEENSTVQGQFDIVGRSREMKDVFQLIEFAAHSNASLLITGESGTGKELVARAVHNYGPRKDRSLITVNCSALPESLLESELFGHVKGAFTGAVHQKQGRFEIADGGTLFLDEIGEISPLIQVKLLRFLQEKEFERIGESKTIKADVRIIAATNKNLRKMVQEGEFREDLFYRLKVFPIELPPLRKRSSDIGDLVQYFIKKFNHETGKNITGLTKDAALTMMDYCWPGNVRELENAIEHAFVICRDGDIDLFDLPLEIRKVELRKNICDPGNTAQQKNISTESYDSPVAVSKPFKKVSREDLISILDMNNWNQSKVAKHFGVNRSTVWRKMQKFNISL